MHESLYTKLEHRKGAAAANAITKNLNLNTQCRNILLALATQAPTETPKESPIVWASRSTNLATVLNKPFGKPFTNIVFWRMQKSANHPSTIRKINDALSNMSVWPLIEHLQMITNDPAHCKIQYIVPLWKILIEPCVSLKCFKTIINTWVKAHTQAFQFPHHYFYKRVCQFMEVNPKQTMNCTFLAHKKTCPNQKHCCFLQHIRDDKKHKLSRRLREILFFWRTVDVLNLPPRTTFSNSLLFGNLSSTTKRFFKK